MRKMRGEAVKKTPKKEMENMTSKVVQKLCSLVFVLNFYEAYKLENLFSNFGHQYNLQTNGPSLITLIGTIIKLEHKYILA